MFLTIFTKFLYYNHLRDKVCPTQLSSQRAKKKKSHRLLYPSHRSVNASQFPRLGIRGANWIEVASVGDNGY